MGAVTGHTNPWAHYRIVSRKYSKQSLIYFRDRLKNQKLIAIETVIATIVSMAIKSWLNVICYRSTDPWVPICWYRRSSVLAIIKFNLTSTFFIPHSEMIIPRIKFDRGPYFSDILSWFDKNSQLHWIMEVSGQNDEFWLNLCFFFHWNSRFWSFDDVLVLTCVLLHWRTRCYKDKSMNLLSSYLCKRNENSKFINLLFISKVNIFHPLCICINGNC